MKSLVVLIAVILKMMYAFHQSDYTLQLDFVRNKYVNRTLISSYKVYATKVNRKITAFSFHICTKIEVGGDELKMNIKLFKLVDNQAKLTVVNFDVRACDIIDSNLLGGKLFRESANVTKCPVEKGCYGGSNVVFDQSAMPPMIPEGRYRADISLYFWKSLMFSNEFYVSVTKRLKIQ